MFFPSRFWSVASVIIGAPLSVYAGATFRWPVRSDVGATFRCPTFKYARIDGRERHILPQVSRDRVAVHPAGERRPGSRSEIERYPGTAAGPRNTAAS